MKTSLQHEKSYALDNAIASVEMEGYEMSEDEKKLCMDVLNGKLSREKFIQIMLENTVIQEGILLYERQ